MAAATCTTAPAETQTRIFPAGTLKRIHVNMHIIRSNTKTGNVDPVTTIQWRNKSYRFDAVEILGASRVVYSPRKPLSCGARVWIETKAEVIGRANPR